MAKRKKKSVKIDIDDLNIRKHGRENREAVRRSLEEFGAGRSVLVDKEGKLIAGECVSTEAERLGIPLRIVDSDGSELVVVRRTDLASDDPRRDELALADNATGEMGTYDIEKAMEIFGADKLEEWGVRMKKERDEEPGEINWSTELDVENNYVVLKFETDIDWINARSLFGLDSTYSQRQNGKPWSKGVGRVVDGVEAIENLKKYFGNGG